MARRGFLIIADITGYTRFLTGSELDHAQGVLEDLFAVILERMKSPLMLSNIQGDAFFAFADDEKNWSPGQIFNSIEALHHGFHDRLTSIVDNTTCTCRACSNAKRLDIKFIVHHGAYTSQNIAGRQELTGPDVILLHRLLKNDVVEQTGIASYALFTAAAVTALDLKELNEAAHTYATDLDEFGRVDGVVVDLGARWRVHHANNVITVADDELWMAPATRLLPFDTETVWTVYWHPEHRVRWNAYVDNVLRARGDPGRLRAGAVDHCAHGNKTFVLHYVDVRPLRHVTIDFAIPLGGRMRRTVAFTAEDNGTRITVRSARPEGPNLAATAMLRLIGALMVKKMVERNTTSELAMMETYIAETAGQRGLPAVATMLPPDEVTRAARDLVTGQT